MADAPLAAPLPSPQVARDTLQWLLTQMTDTDILELYRIVILQQLQIRVLLERVPR